MKIKRFNEAAEQPKTFGELIGNIIEEHDTGYRSHTMVETDKGVFLHEYNAKIEAVEKIMQYEYEIDDFGGSIGYIYIKNNGNVVSSGYVYLEGGVPKIISRTIGDGSGSDLFNDTFIVYGDEGLYLYDVNQPDVMKIISY